MVPRLAVADEAGATRVVLEHRVVLEPPQELHQQERVPLHPSRPLQEVIVWFGAQDVCRDQRHGLALERPKADVRGATFDQIRLRLLHRCEALVRTKGEHPCHGKRSESWPELPYRDRAAGPRPVQIIEADKDRRLQRCFLDHRLEILDEPEHELWGRMRVTEGTSVS